MKLAIAKTGDRRVYTFDSCPTEITRRSCLAVFCHLIDVMLTIELRYTRRFAAFGASSGVDMALSDGGGACFLTGIAPRR